MHSGFLGSVAGGPICFLFACTLFAQPSTNYTIEPVAGTPRLLGDNGPATAALLWSPQGVTVDAAGNLYIADTGNGRIRKVTPGGIISTIAGSTPGFSGDAGAATEAQLSFPAKAIVAPGGDLYIVDTGNNRIRRLAPNGVITTVAGTGQAGFAGDGTPAGDAQLNFPRDIAIDPSGALLVLDTGNVRVRRFTPGGIIGTIAGSGILGFYGDTLPAVRAQFASPWGLAIDRSGNIFIADTFNDRIRRISPDGIITTIAGINGAGYQGDNGPAIFARLNRPTGIAVDSSGNVFIADTVNHRIRKIDASGTIVSIAGTGAAGFSGDGGPAVSAQLNMPESLAVDASGNIYVADTGNHRVRVISPRGTITTVAGSDPAAGDGGPATKALLFQPSGVAFDASGDLYVSDTLNNRIRRIGREGIIATFAGTGSPGYSGDNGLATRAQLNQPNGLSFDSAGNLYIADTGNHVIRMVNPSGLISTVAGSGVLGNSGDTGAAKLATLFSPSDVVVDRAGNIYVADSGNNRIRRVTPEGLIDNYAGDAAGLPGSDGDNGPARQARFDYPIGLAIDENGSLYVSDYFNNRIRKIAAGTTMITTYAGTGTGGFGGDNGPAIQARLHLPAGISLDRQGNLYVADLLNNRIRVIGANGIIRTIAGSGIPGDSGAFGPAAAALLSSPRDVAVDVQGSVYFTDQDNSRVRRLVAESVTIRSIVNAASLQAGWAAPGEAVSIYGIRLGPVVGVSGSAANGVFGTNLGGTRVLVDDVPAPLLYVSNNQVNAIVPYETGGRSTTNVRIEVQDSLADTFTLAISDAAPGIFTSDSSGRGQAAAVNQSGTLNSPAHPADRGSVVALFVTGEGATVPAGITGKVITDLNALPRPIQDVKVKIQGLPAEVLYAGAAPYSSALMQINVRIPGEVFASTRVPVEVTVGPFAAQPGVFIAVQ
jgi:uncharacterized protein (TIGR03437 family)